MFVTETLTIGDQSVCSSFTKLHDLFSGTSGINTSFQRPDGSLTIQTRAMGSIRLLINQKINIHPVSGTNVSLCK